jgi:hypothetical protein
MKILEHKDKRVLIEFDNQFVMATTLLRFQETYECSNTEFRNNPFTLEDYMDWEYETKGHFSYFDDIAGFNFPSSIVDKLEKFTDLTNKEKKFIELIKESKVGIDEYIIGYVEGDKDELDHEISHAKFYLSETYKENASKLYETISNEFTNSLSDHLLSIGYSEDVIVDESIAYLIYGIEELDDFYDNLDETSIYLIDNVREELKSL